MFHSWRSRLCIAILIPLYAATIFLSLDPERRARLHSYLRLDQKVLLSTVSGDLRGDGTSIKVLKFRAAEGIILEFLGPLESGSRPLIDRVLFQDHLDGYFDISGEASRLAVVDLDGDGKLEVIAPTIEPGLMARLNALHFNPATQKFQPIQ